MTKLEYASVLLSIISMFLSAFGDRLRASMQEEPEGSDLLGGRN